VLSALSIFGGKVSQLYLKMDWLLGGLHPDPRWLEWGGAA